MLIDNDYKEGGLKSVDIELKIASLKCSWIQRLYNEKFHDWKLIPLHYIEKILGKHFKFHSNLNIPPNLLRSFPKFYREIINWWSKLYSRQPTVPSTISSQFLWFNTFIKVDNTVIHKKHFSENHINFVNDFFDANGNVKSWKDVVNEFKIKRSSYFKWCQLIHAIPRSWKKI